MALKLKMICGLISFWLVIGVAFPGAGESERQQGHHKERSYGWSAPSSHHHHDNYSPYHYNRNVIPYPYITRDRVIVYGPLDQYYNTYRIESYQIIPHYYSVCDYGIRTYREGANARSQTRLCPRRPEHHSHHHDSLDVHDFDNDDNNDNDNNDNSHLDVYTTW